MAWNSPLSASEQEAMSPSDDEPDTEERVENKARLLLTKVLVTDLENPDLLHEVKREIDEFLKTNPETLEDLMGQQAHEAETNAWNALSRYKFIMFGYWAAAWVRANKFLGLPNPFAVLVRLAETEMGRIRAECIVREHIKAYKEVEYGQHKTVENKLDQDKG